MAQLEPSIYQLLASESLELACSKINSHILKISSGCEETDYATDDKNYSQTRYRGKKYYCHVLTAMRHYGRPPKQGEEVSHLCHNRKCVKPQHLVMESGLVNKSRLCCEIYKNKKGYFCPHEPTCTGLEAVKKSE